MEFPDTMSVVVTGANGYLGSKVCAELVLRGWRVIALRYHCPCSVVYRHPDLRYLECDITDDLVANKALVSALRESSPRAIINCAAILGSRRLEENLAVNARGVENLIQLARHLGIEKFIHISSVVTIKARRGPYGESKKLGDEIVKSSGLDYTIFVPAMVLGPDSLGLNRMLKNIFRFPKIVPIIGSGKATQHPVFIDDFVRIIVKSILNEESRRKVYEIAGDRRLSFVEFVNEILEIRGSRKLLVPIPVWLAKTAGRLFSIFQETPVFTAEHVVGVTQDSLLSNEAVREDLGSEMTPFRQALEYCLEEIGDDWESRLRARPERVVVVEARGARASAGGDEREA